MSEQLVRYIAAALCVIAAIVLAIMNRDGWGWFLFVALLLAGAA